jgi:division protein CdvB (Snf7/Vps24/ESCRT-III family)
MRIRKIIDEDGVKAAVAVNVNEPGSVTAASSSQGAEVEEDAEKVKDESGRELPDREGTYDELREEATREANEGDQDD